MVTPVEIAGRPVGPGHPCFLIAEAGVNHDGSLARALDLVTAAADACADAVKFQTFTAASLATTQAPKASYQVRTTDPAESQFEMLRRLELGEDAHRTLQSRCQTLGLPFLSSPFDEASADLLERQGVLAFKIASGEITNSPLLAHVARKGRPIILSTGMSSLEEVEQAVAVIRGTSTCGLVLLHCVSNYPAAPADANLRAMATMAARFDLPVGYSDHTVGREVALAAVALGACVIEKHFTLDRALPGPDHATSLEPSELAALVQEVRAVEAALGDGRKRPMSAEAEVARVARKSLVAACDIQPGTVLTEELVAIRRPGTGLPPAAWPQVIGRTTKLAISAGTPFAPEMLA